MSDKTFAETQGEAPFDWWRALNNPPALDSEEHMKLSDLAASWVTCACGNQCAIIPRAEDETTGRRRHAPLDPLLNTWGGDFLGAVSATDWGKAREILRAIESRSAILIAQELAKRNQPTP